MELIILRRNRRTAQRWWTTSDKPLLSVNKTTVSFNKAAWKVMGGRPKGSSSVLFAHSAPIKALYVTAIDREIGNGYSSREYKNHFVVFMKNGVDTPYGIYRLTAKPVKLHGSTWYGTLPLEVPGKVTKRGSGHPRKS